MRRTGFIWVIVLLGLCPAMFAQVPTPAAITKGQENAGFTPGWTLGARFEGSISDDGGIYDLGTAFGRNFSRHLGVDFGLPFYFLNSPSSTKKNNPDAVSGIGIGTFFTDLRLNYPGKNLNYGSAVHLTMPTADTKKGLSTGHVTWNLSNHFDYAFGDFSPFLDAGVGNSVLDTRWFRRPFITFGYNAQFEGGLEYDLGKFSFSASAYDVAPWGNQTVISRVYRCGKSEHCSGNASTTNRKNYTTASVSSGPASLVRDNGFNAGIDCKPTSHTDLEFDFSRSVPLQLNTYSFGIGFDLSGMLQRHAH